MFFPPLITACLFLSNLAVGSALALQSTERRTTTASLPVRVITHNIRYDADPPSEGEEPWSERKQLLLNQLLYHTNNQESFIFLQEVLHNQLTDVLSGLNPRATDSGPDSEWAYIGVGRDDGDEEGEYAPILYRPETWKLQDWETVWLSETPDVPSKGWDAAAIRIVTIGRFEHRETKTKVLALNTHFDHRGPQARLEGAKLILRRIEEHLSGNPSYSTVILGGDFNSEEDDAAYQTLTASNSTLEDSQNLVAPEKRYGNENTFTGFAGERAKRIDYILLGPSSSSQDSMQSSQQSTTNWSIEGYGVLSNRFEDGVFISDHRAVVVDVEL